MEIQPSIKTNINEKFKNIFDKMSFLSLQSKSDRVQYLRVYGQ